MFNKMQFVNEFNSMYLDRLKNNEETLIEAFVSYYGEEFRDFIVKQYEKIIFCWFTHDKISTYYNDYICPNIFKNRIEMTETILEKLGYPKEVSSQDKQALNSLLNFLFGSERTFGFHYENNPIYNFFLLIVIDNKKL